jgi:glycogen synthase
MFYYEDPSCAGLSSYYFNLVQSLCELGHRIFLVVPEESAPGTAVPGLEVLTIRNRHLTANDGAKGLGALGRFARRLIFSIQVVRKIRQIDRSANIDLIVAPELFAPGLFVGFFMGHKLITRIHTPTYIGDAYNKRYRMTWIGNLLSLVERIQVSRSRGVSVASAHLASVIARDWRIPPDRIHVIPNSVQVEWVRNLAAKQPREIPGRYLLYFGRIERRKGVHVLSRSLSAVLATVPDISMVFVGRDCGLNKSILQENLRFQDRIVFLDTLEKPRLFGIIRFAQLVILPSLFENLSNAGLEAMALGRPVIGTYGTAFEELIRDGINGFLVEPGNADALERKILSCLKASDLEQIGRNGYETVLQFDSRKIAAQNIQFYRSMLAGR